jgi:hypothetical protein
MKIRIKLYTKIAIFIKKNISIKKVLIIKFLKNCVDLIAEILKFLSFTFYQCEKILYPISSRIVAFDPYSPIYICWETIIFLINLRWLVMIPFWIAFSPQDLYFGYYNPQDYLKSFEFIILNLDIFIQLNTQTIILGTFVTSRTVII